MQFWYVLYGSKINKNQVKPVQNRQLYLTRKQLQDFFSQSRCNLHGYDAIIVLTIHMQVPSITPIVHNQ